MQKGKRRLLCSLRGREKGDATRLPARISSTTRCVVRRLAAAGAAGVWGSKNRALRSHRSRPRTTSPLPPLLAALAPPSRTCPGCRPPVCLSWRSGMGALPLPPPTARPSGSGHRALEPRGAPHAGRAVPRRRRRRGGDVLLGRLTHAPQVPPRLFDRFWEVQE